MRKLLLKSIVVMMCLAVWVLPSMANTYTDHVSVQTNAIGDLIVYPVYFAGDGVQTHFAVINTSDVYSTVAKVVIRSHRFSREMVDFLIYLSPNDEFKATITYEGGKYVVKSTDDSLAASPIKYELYAPCRGEVANDDPSYGYIEVFEAWSQDINKITDPDDGPVGTVLKKTIIAAYKNSEATAFKSHDDVITGFAELDFGSLGTYSVYQPTVFCNYGINAEIGTGLKTELGVDSANNNLAEVEAALAKNNLVFPYYNNENGATVGILTFPTKLSGCPATLNGVTTYTAKGPFFACSDGCSLEDFGVSYERSMYDLTELHHKDVACTRSPCVTDKLQEEVNILWPLSPSLFDEGWVRYSFGQSTTANNLSGEELTYTGAPVIPLVAELTANGLSLMPVAYDFGSVTTGATNVDGVYQQSGCW